MDILIMILITALLFNVLIYAYSEKIKNYFTNVYIQKYISLTKKLIGIECFFLGITILYFMYSLSNGIYFIATHPIIIN